MARRERPALSPEAAERRRRHRLGQIRGVVVLTSLLGLNYVTWRWLFSVNWDAWWIGVPLVLAETYSLIDSLLFGLGMWRLRERGDPPVRRSRWGCPSTMCRRCCRTTRWCR